MQSYCHHMILTAFQSRDLSYRSSYLTTKATTLGVNRIMQKDVRHDDRHDMRAATILAVWHRSTLKFDRLTIKADP